MGQQQLTREVLPAAIPALIAAQVHLFQDPFTQQLFQTWRARQAAMPA